MRFYFACWRTFDQVSDRLLITKTSLDDIWLEKRKIPIHNHFPQTHLYIIYFSYCDFMDRYIYYNLANINLGKKKESVKTQLKVNKLTIKSNHSRKYQGWVNYLHTILIWVYFPRRDLKFKTI